MATEIETHDAALPTEIQAWHVHLDHPPYCKTWWRENAEQRARTYAYEYGLEAEGPYSYASGDCPYKQEREAADGGLPVEEQAQATVLSDSSEVPSDGYAIVNPFSTAEEIEMLPEEEDTQSDEAVPDEVPEIADSTASPSMGSITTAPHSTTIDLSTVVCDTCGEPMDQHQHPKGGADPSSGSKRARKKPDERPACPHCGGPIHWNDAAAKQNFECLFRQFLVAAGTITEPLTQRLPVATHVDLADLGRWIEGQKASGAELRYGKMESAGGAGGTYASLRPTRAAVPAGPSIEEIAASADPMAASATALGYAMMGISPEQAAAAAAAEAAESAEDEKKARRKRRKELLKKAKR